MSENTPVDGYPAAVASGDGAQPSTVFTNPASTTVASGDDTQPSTVFTNPASTAVASGDSAQPSTVFTNPASTAVADIPPPNRSAAGLPQSLALGSVDRNAFTSAASTQHLGYPDSKATTLAARPNTSASSTGLQAPSQKGAVLKKKRTKLYLILGGIAAVVVVATAVAVPVAITQRRKSSSAPSTSFTGGDGSTIITETGATFAYANKFGGTWYDDPNDPFNNNAQAQSWSPPLSQEWDYQNHPMRGVNLGGWLVLDPLIVPSLFERYLNASPPVLDEWSLSIAMAADTARGGLSQLENHYDTFITEEDFAQIAAAGLNWVRLPIPYWVVEKYPEEPFLEKVPWKYALKAFKWARKYGLRINLVLHTIPGSQNGYNHSGKGGQINFLYGPMGLANAQRTLDYIRIITEFISQPEYAPVIPMLGIINEPLATTIGVDQMTSFYLQVHDMIRNIAGTGKGNGPFISIHDSFLGLAPWKDLLPGHDRLALESHKYLFSTVDRSALHDQIEKPCQAWGAEMNSSWTDFGVSVAGEFSLAINDCGRWVNGIELGTRWEGTLTGSGDGVKGDCTEWNDWASWGQQTKDDFKAFAQRNFDAFGHWFFYTWKISASSITGKIESPMWSYQLGWKEGWIPEDPTQATGVCGNTSPAQPLSPEMVGAAGPGEISASVRAQYPWPPNQLNPNSLNPNSIPVYTATGAIPTLPVPTPTTGTVDGWFNPADTRPMYTPISRCDYPDTWGSAEASNPGRC
ncbi:hypothetical protein FRC01_002946 [Tulasnella sp. 417]|nr:hypothetical protein FRC01_002946 [Tulasnella sp. 417]